MNTTQIPADLNTVGTFHAGKVGGRRVRVFVDAATKQVGASVRYSRIEAWRNSAASNVTVNPGESALAALLRAKGFPVTDSTDMDDTTAAALVAELT